ncbi:MAG: hypothetical protein OJF50_002732 [Nitrospira sp.]|jgi:hypothetical protein|nr:hypothetical protein [Nitrospira sp.]
MSFFQNSVQWLVHHPLATATFLYMTAVVSALVYTYFESRDQHSMGE